MELADSKESLSEFDIRSGSLLERRNGAWRGNGRGGRYNGAWRGGGEGGGCNGAWRDDRGERRKSLGSWSLLLDEREALDRVLGAGGIDRL